MTQLRLATNAARHSTRLPIPKSCDLRSLNTGATIIVSGHPAESLAQHGVGGPVSQSLQVRQRCLNERPQSTSPRMLRLPTPAL